MHSSFGRKRVATSAPSARPSTSSLLVQSRPRSLVQELQRMNFGQLTSGLTAGLPGQVVEGKVVLTTVSKTESKVEQGIDVQFLVDTSGSMCGRPIEKVHEELLFLLFESGCVREHDFVSITAFNSKVDPLLPWTRRSALSPSMVKPLQASGGTELWQAVHYVIDQRKAFQEAKDKKRMEEKKVCQSKKPFVLLVLTDGESADTKKTAESVKTRIATIGVEVAHFHMHVLGVGLNVNAERTLRDVCSASPMKCEMTNIGAGVHATEAISCGFRKTFTKVINTVTQRTITASSGGVTVRDKVLTSSSGPSQASSFIRPALETACIIHGLPPIPSFLLSSLLSYISHPLFLALSLFLAISLPVKLFLLLLFFLLLLLLWTPLGSRCRHLLAHKHCAFKHDKGDIPCKWGSVCKGRSSGTCPFRH